MATKIPIQAQRTILKLEKEVLNLKKRIARMEAKHKKEIEKLKPKDVDVKIVCDEKTRQKMIEARNKFLTS